MTPNTLPPPQQRQEARAAPDRSTSRVRGAREHKLKKNVDLKPPATRGRLTGVSGSGKSSLAFGTLREAQRRI